MIYRIFFRLVLRRVDPERAHALAATSLRAVAAIPPLRALLRRLLVARDERLRVHALGLTFPSPLGVAAGVDKDASWFEGLAMLGFGFVEVGTVTALPQAGNPRPRLVRLVSDRALLNRMGFPNPGARMVAEQLRGRSRRTVVGVNIGRSRKAERPGEDYRASARALAPEADYLVINVSSPNTPGLRAMQAVSSLRPLVEDVRQELREAGVSVPTLVKIGPDLGDDELDEVAALALELGLAGIVAVNTTPDRGGVEQSPEAARIEGGGISGAPLKPQALRVLRRLRARVGDRLVLVSVGGVETAADAWERILAGATLVQGYTGLVYQGPGWPARMNRELARLVGESGCQSVQQLVGAASPEAATTGSQKPD